MNADKLKTFRQTAYGGRGRPRAHGTKFKLNDSTELALTRRVG